MLTRLAPSPTGALHVGNARTFVLTWVMARQYGWGVTLRVDDLDGPRVKAGAADAAVADLRWLGLDWDAGPTMQSHGRAAHAAAVEQLVAAGHAYPCVCTRREVDASASAPHAEDGSAVYPGTCRGRFSTVADAVAQTGRAAAVRFRVPSQGVSWDDRIAGPQRYADVAAALGDFVIAKADRTPAYQLATVVDDAAGGVTHVVRGDDLLDSTPRQILLYRALNMADRTPAYAHLPLVVGPDGRRLAKRHGDTRLAALRATGVTAGRVRQWIAERSGMTVDADAPIADLVGRFDPARLPRMPVVCDGDEWIS